MISLLFGFGNEKVIVVVDENNVKFGTTAFGSVLADISGLHLNYNGVCREFPDLETHKDWRGEAIKRFKEKIKSMNNENDVCEYIIKELRSCGYVPESKQRNGFRIERLR